MEERIIAANQIVLITAAAQSVVDTGSARPSENNLNKTHLPLLFQPETHAWNELYTLYTLYTVYYYSWRIQC